MREYAPEKMATSKKCKGAGEAETVGRDALGQEEEGHVG